MYEKNWEHFIISFSIVTIIMSIGWVVSRVLRRRWHAQRTYDTYMLTDGVVNSVTVTLDVKFGEVERRRILSANGTVLSTYAPTFDPNSVSSAQPVR
jgi:hypothetical protein